MTTSIDSLKKDLQKIVKKHRDAKPDCTRYLSGGHTQPCRPEFPKAMMTRQQMAKGTATINFGYNCQRHHDEIDAFTAAEAFKTFCEKHDVKVGPKEINSDNRVQLRLYY